MLAPHFMERIKAYIGLTKPGIIRGNILTAAAGFFMAAQGSVNFVILGATIVGLGLIIASACVFNNYIDRDIDKKMARTKKRALVSGDISGTAALIYACILGITGTIILTMFVNSLATAMALFGLFAYVVIYGIAKRGTVHGTVIGSISGAVPPVVGYVAVTNQLDLGAYLLFLILVVWQMPHFYAIAIFRKNDYSAAHIPVLPIVKGIKATKFQILFYIIAFIVAVSLLTIYGYTGYAFLASMLLMSLWWLKLAFSGFGAPDDVLWARKVFGFSLLILLSFSVLVALDSFLIQ